MCRWLLWCGKSTVVANLIFGAHHSLAEQSEAAGYTPGEPRCAEHRSRNHAVNVHGCGIGWYGNIPGAGLVDALGLSSYERPAVYTTTSAPSHDRNLRSLSKMVESSLLFGHVRAAGPGAAVHLYNTHPFSCGRYLFQHNGALGNFTKIRRKLLATLRDCLFEWLSGTTDSELLFALFLNALPDCVTLQPPEVLAAALKDTIRLVVEAAAGELSSINVSCTDGECVLATRFRDGPGETAPSLYYHTGPLTGASWDLQQSSGLGGMTANMTHDGLMVTHEPSGTAHLLSSSYDGGGNSVLSRRSSFERRKPHPRQSLLVASEPLTEDGAADISEWRVFPPNTMMVALPRWRGGDQDGKRARRCDLQDSAPADDADVTGEPVVVLDIHFQSLESLAAHAGSFVSAAMYDSVTAASSAPRAVAHHHQPSDPTLPPRCPPRTGSGTALTQASGIQLAPSESVELDFGKVSFD